jgi:DhnA family fructose-bisphosphate aldolase class Ia
MNTSVLMHMERLFNHRQDKRAVCIAADHGYMSNVSSNVINLRAIAQAVVRGGADGILLSPGQAHRLSSLFEGPNAPALIVRADWMNMPRLDSADHSNPVPPQHLFHQKMLSAKQALALGATAITIYLFLGTDDRMEATGIESCAQFVNECHRVGLPCIAEPLAFGAQVTPHNLVDLLILGARMSVELGVDALKIPYTGDVESFSRLVKIANVPVLVLGGARSENEQDTLQLLTDGLEAGCSGCLMGRRVTQSPNPEELVRQLVQIAHRTYSMEAVKQTEQR